MSSLPSALPLYNVSIQSNLSQIKFDCDSSGLFFSFLLLLAAKPFKKEIFKYAHMFVCVYLIKMKVKGLDPRIFYVSYLP